MTRRRPPQPMNIPPALRNVPEAMLRERIRRGKDDTGFDVRFARRILKSLGPVWGVLEPALRERILEVITQAVVELVNPLIKDIIVDMDVTALVAEGRGPVQGIDHMIGPEDAEFLPILRSIIETTFEIGEADPYDGFRRRRVGNCLIALRSQQKSMVTAYRADGVDV